MIRWVWRTIDASPRAAVMTLRVTLVLAALVLADGIGRPAPAAAQASVQPAGDSVNTFTAKRFVASVAAGVALIGAVVGGLTLARSAVRSGSGHGRRGAIVALVLGPIGLLIGLVIVATADGGVGTGNGLAGGVVAMIVGLIAMSLGGLALARSRRMA